MGREVIESQQRKNQSDSWVESCRLYVTVFQSELEVLKGTNSSQGIKS